ncbi:TetR/AcrR family transcriptional regulator [Crossiella cryophila]|uniref:AcrR family transcriptional regulator n=1 Tax=Crossiella cryophila TaxID=43355 RepID=A0A7W7CCU4_9PSEU|nr:TetR/AcrR family transcriptional regulator [Crossiella cryophila]MBB4678763.1 AcrR family transcriptional regulator [Crossiella cryophila]
MAPRGTGSGTYHHGDLKRALVDAALELVAEKGPQGFTMTEAAKRAGVSVAAPYRHFADKDALLAEVAEQGFVVMGQALDRSAARGSKDSREVLLRMSRAYVRWAVANPDHYRVMFGDAYGVEEFEDVRPAGRNMFMKLHEAIEVGQAAGVIRAQDPRAVAGPIWSVLHGIATLQIGRKFRALGLKEAADALALRTITALLDSPEFTNTAEG